MPHLDPDRLVLLALADGAPDQIESAHLASCASCRDDVEALQHVAELGSETQGMVGLPPPPPHVWAGIQDQLQGPAPVRPAHAAVRARRRRRWAAPILSAVAAAVLAVAGTATVVHLTDRPPAPDVTAQATLARLPLAPPAAVGSARVLSHDELTVSVRNLPLTTGYYEVWLIDPDNLTKMIALGNLAGSSAALPLPPGADLNRYRLVDVSAEAFDGNAAHSGKSLLRGTLTS